MISIYMCDTDNSLDASMLKITEPCLALVLANIIIKIYEIVGDHINRYYQRVPDNSEDLSEELIS